MSCKAFGFCAVTTSGTTTVWASLAEADTALGVVASGFFMRFANRQENCKAAKSSHSERSEESM